MNDLKERLEEIKNSLIREGGKDVEINFNEGWVEFTNLKGGRGAYQPYGNGWRYISPNQVKKSC